MSIRATVIAVLVALITALSFGVYYYHDAYSETSSKLKLANTTISDMQTRQRDVAALDAKYTKELADAKSKNDDLRRKFDRGGRVLVKANCPAPNASSGSVGYAETVELSSIAGRNVLDIRSGIISDQTKIKYLQDYIRRIINERDKN